MRRTLLLVVCSLGSSLLTGCVFPYCAYPKLDYTPAVRLSAPKSIPARGPIAALG